jgi:hypothetical protein
MTEHDQNLRDIAAMFAMAGLLIRGKQDANIIKLSFELADEYMLGRKPDGGLATIKKRKKDVPES